MKRFGLIAGLVGLLGLLVPVIASAAGNCTEVNVGNSASTQVLAANDLGSGGRHMLCVWNTTAPVSAGATSTVAYCNIGGAAAAAQGFPLMQGALGGATWPEVPAVPFCWPATQQAAKTFPIVPSGALNCIGTASTTNVTACDY